MDHQKEVVAECEKSTKRKLEDVKKNYKKRKEENSSKKNAKDREKNAKNNLKTWIRDFVTRFHGFLVSICAKSVNDK